MHYLKIAISLFKLFVFSNYKLCIKYYKIIKRINVIEVLLKKNTAFQISILLSELLLKFL